ncbi:MAG: 50S ribosomal protein L19 [Phycisphaerae bacterium]|nr:50S ribosomal protein L19 [Phycisphaerae bacterium]
MRHPLLDAAEQKYQRSNALSFEIGDTVAVTMRIIEGDKERLQDFIGTVIARRGRGTSETFIVRRLVGNEGVERCFPLHSPKVATVKVVRSGKVRRCKLYFLRERVGKARKLRERRISAEARKAASEARAAKANAVAEAAAVVESSRGEAAMATT